jgi:hypothetical protein
MKRQIRKFTITHFTELSLMPQKNWKHFLKALKNKTNLSLSSPFFIFIPKASGTYPSGSTTRGG